MVNNKNNFNLTLLGRLKKLDTTCVSDAADRLGITCGLLDIKPVISGTAICGPAFTVHYVPCGVIKGTVGDFLDDVLPGQVVVIDNGGRTYCTVWGDLMSIYAGLHRIEGTVIDGVCRDIPVIQKLKYPIFSRGSYMVTGKDRVEVDAVNVPVAISGVQVKPGDFIMGDDSGVIALPQEKLEDILNFAEEIALKEAQNEAFIKSGLSLKEARSKVSYHKLQSK